MSKDVKKLYFNVREKLNLLKARKRDSNLSNFNVSVQDINGNKTLVGFDPNVVASETMTDEGLSLRNECRAILETGFNQENYVKILSILDSNKDIVEKEWILTLNKARCLGFLGYFEKAEEFAIKVKNSFITSGKAVGTANEVLSWLEERNQYHSNGDICLESLEKRSQYIWEGLKTYPDGHALLMNAFEVSVLYKNGEQALRYLEIGCAVNKDYIRVKLFEASLEKMDVMDKARALTPRLRQEIDEIIRGDKEMKIYDIIRASAFVILPLLALTSFFYKQEFPNIQLPKTVYSASIVKLSTLKIPSLLKEQLRTDGTDFGKRSAKADNVTDFG